MFRHIANQSGLSLERLSSLCEVAEAGSIGQASRGDANRQSLLSRQIAELEVVFGTPLLARQSRPYRLTNEGLELARAARAFFQSAEDLRLRVENRAQRVVIGAGETFIQWALFPACEKVKQHRAEHVVFSFKNLESARLMEALQQGVVDAALIRQENVTPGLAHSPPWSYAQTAFVPKALCHAVCALKTSELASLPWAVLEGHGHFRQFLEDRARTLDIRLNVVLECSSYSQVAQAVQSGRYAGFLPDFAKAPFVNASAVIRRPLEKPLAYERNVVLAWRESTVRTRPAIESLFEDLKKCLGHCF